MEIESVCIGIKDLEKIIKERIGGLENKVKELTELLEDAGQYLKDYELHNENGCYGLAEESYLKLKDVLNDYI